MADWPRDREPSGFISGLRAGMQGRRIRTGKWWAIASGVVLALGLLGWLLLGSGGMLRLFQGIAMMLRVIGSFSLR
jgi:hypothetical protein